MIALRRVRTREAVVTSYRGRTPVNRLVRLMQEMRDSRAANRAPDLDFKGGSRKWGKTKDQLLAETHGKCAYCESDMSVVAFGDVEHYRPKSVYWWLAYVYDNYLASCSVCNQQFKSARFEFTGQRMPEPPITGAESDADLKSLARAFAPDPLKPAEVAAFATAHAAEAPLIPNPYFDDPEALFGWEVFEGAQEVLVVPRPGNARAAKVVEACERIYGLNRPQLKRRRFKQWKTYRFTARVAQDAGADAGLRADAREMLDLLAGAESEYAAMVRHFHAAAPAG